MLLCDMNLGEYAVKKRKAAAALILFVIITVTSVFSVSADSFSGENVKLTLPDEFFQLTAKNLSSHTDLLRQLGYSESSFKEELNSDGMVMFAVNNDASRQINLKIAKSSLSERIVSLNEQTDERIEEISSSLESGINEQGYSMVLSRSRLENNGVLFINLMVKVVNGEKEFCYVQYYTILNGLNYSLVYYNNSPELSQQELDECSAMFKSLQIKNTHAENSGYMGAIQIIIAVVAVAAFTALAVWIIVSLVKDYKRQRRENSIQKLGRK